LSRAVAKHDALAHVSAENIKTAIAIEIDQADVRHGRGAWHLVESPAVADERER